MNSWNPSPSRSSDVGVIGIEVVPAPVEGGALVAVETTGIEFLDETVLSAHAAKTRADARPSDNWSRALAPPRAGANLLKGQPWPKRRRC